MGTNKDKFNRKNNGSICIFEGVKLTEEVIDLFKKVGFSTPLYEKVCNFNEFDFKEITQIGEKFIIDWKNNLYEIIECFEMYHVMQYKVKEVSSLYAQTEEGVYRLSNHWGNVGKSYWTVDPVGIVGFAKWENFKFNEE